MFPLRCRMAPSALTERLTSSVPFAQIQRRSSARDQLRVRGQLPPQRQGKLQHLFIAFQLRKAVLPKGSHGHPAGQIPVVFPVCQQGRAKGGKAGQNFSPSVWQGAGTGQGHGLVQGAGQRFRLYRLRGLFCLKFRGEGICHALQLVGPPCPQAQHQGGGQAAGFLPFSLRERKAHRLGRGSGSPRSGRPHPAPD